MPGGDRTGPLGMGPMTGRGAGYCAGNTVPGYMNPYGGRGLGMARGRGYGRGFGGGYASMPVGGYPAYQPGANYPYPPSPAPMYGNPYAPGIDPNPSQEVDALKQQAGYLEDMLANIKNRMAEIESATAGEKEE